MYPDEIEILWDGGKANYLNSNLVWKRYEDGAQRLIATEYCRSGGTGSVAIDISGLSNFLNFDEMTQLSERSSKKRQLMVQWAQQPGKGRQDERYGAESPEDVMAASRRSASSETRHQDSESVRRESAPERSGGEHAEVRRAGEDSAERTRNAPGIAKPNRRRQKHQFGQALRALTKKSAREDRKSQGQNQKSQPAERGKEAEVGHEAKGRRRSSRRQQRRQSTANKTNSR